jgi:hypothetical protein
VAAVVVAAVLTALTITWLVLRDDAAELETEAAVQGTSAEQLREALDAVAADQGGTAPSLRAATIARSEALDSAAPGELDVFMMLTALHTIATPEATIHQIEVDAADASLVLEGQAASGDAAADYLERLLADLLWIDDAYIVETAPLDTTGTLAFRVEATVNEQAFAAAPSFEASLDPTATASTVPVAVPVTAPPSAGIETTIPAAMPLPDAATTETVLPAATTETTARTAETADA